jgi:hypothetical protein
MLTSVHVENFGRLLGSNGRVFVHFSRQNCSHPLRHSGSGVIYEALFSSDQKINTLTD